MSLSSLHYFLLVLYFVSHSPAFPVLLILSLVLSVSAHPFCLPFSGHPYLFSPLHYLLLSFSRIPFTLISSPPLFLLIFVRLCSSILSYFLRSSVSLFPFFNILLSLVFHSPSFPVLLFLLLLSVFAHPYCLPSSADPCLSPRFTVAFLLFIVCHSPSYPVLLFLSSFSTVSANPYYLPFPSDPSLFPPLYCFLSSFYRSPFTLLSNLSNPLLILDRLCSSLLFSSLL